MIVVLANSNANPFFYVPNAAAYLYLFDVEMRRSSKEQGTLVRDDGLHYVVLGVVHMMTLLPEFNK